MYGIDLINTKKKTSFDLYGLEKISHLRDDDLITVDVVIRASWKSVLAQRLLPGFGFHWLHWFQEEKKISYEKQKLFQPWFYVLLVASKVML